LGFAFIKIMTWIIVL